MGSIFFIDFIMLHKLLGVKNMLSVERSQYTRVKFNRPFSDSVLRVEEGLVGDFIHELSPLKKHIVWLDYDTPLTSTIAADVELFVSRMPAGSIFIVTVDVEQAEHTVVKEHPDTGVLYEELVLLDTPSNRQDYYKKVVGSYFYKSINGASFEDGNFYDTTVKLLRRMVDTGMSGRKINFFPLFNFSYSDGNEMLTFGGVLGNEQERKVISKSRLRREPFIRSNIYKGPFVINIPILTRKEKLYLDSNMPCDDGWVPEEFDLSAEYISAYREIYRFYPSYVEMLL